MKNKKLRKIVMTAVLAAIAVACSPLSVPVGASKCFPVQHLVNIIGGVFLGPLYAAAAAFVSATAALAVEGFKKKYHRYPTVAEIKQCLIKAAVPLSNVPREKQGYGFIDVNRLEQQFI